MISGLFSSGLLASHALSVLHSDLRPDEEVGCIFQRHCKEIAAKGSQRA